MNIRSNIIKSYDDMLYESRPIAFNEFINDKLNKVHNELYIDALSKYFDDIIKNTINGEFAYNFYTAMENNSEALDNTSYDKVWDAIQRLDANTQLKKSFKILELNFEDFFKDIYEITYNALDNLTKNSDDYSNIGILGDIHDFRIIYVDDYIFLANENNADADGDVIISYKIDNETDLLVEEKFFVSELKDYVIVLEKYKGTRIGYNKNGEWILIIDKNDQQDINETQLNNLINKFKEIKNVSLCLIELYRNIALTHYKRTHKIIELKNSEYWMPSSISVISCIRPYTKKIVSLEKYWNMSQSFKNLNIYDIKVTNENILDAELCELNYITGMAKIRSRQSGIEYEVPFKYLSGDINVDPEMTLNNGFIPKYNDL